MKQKSLQRLECIYKHMKSVLQILDLHSVPNYTQNGSIYADSMEAGTEVFEKVENVTGWSRSQLYAWLGY